MQAADSGKWENQGKFEKRGIEFDWEIIE